MIYHTGKGYNSHQQDDGLEDGEGVSKEAIYKMLISLVLKGKIRTAVRVVILRGAGGVLLPNKIEPKSGQSVIDMLCQKHLALIVPTVGMLEHYNVVPKLVLLDFTEETLEIISGKLTGAVDLDGIETSSL